MQRRVVLWIIEVFHTPPTQGIETIAELIPIHLHFNKIIRHYYLQVASFSKQHAINILINKHHSKIAILYYMAMSHLIIKQHSKIKSFIMDINNHLNKVLPSFNSLNKELSSKFHLVDTFLEFFPFFSVNQKNSNILTFYYNRLINIFESLLINQDTVLITKSVYYTINIISMEAKLFVIRYRINHIVQLQDITHIIIITDIILAAKQIFNSFVHLY